ncbi:MAG: acyltransferase, partial [Sinomicrobium sp.]|nr:acyltransferase [Sinomicrobium sp.]
MKIAIAPEGTRKPVDKLKTGFYYIAKGADVPILFCKFDYGNKIIGISEPFYTTNDIEADFASIYAYYQGVKGRKPEYGFGVN